MIFLALFSSKDEDKSRKAKQTPQVQPAQPTTPKKKTASAKPKKTPTKEHTYVRPSEQKENEDEEKAVLEFLNMSPQVDVASTKKEKSKKEKSKKEKAKPKGNEEADLEDEEDSEYQVINRKKTPKKKEVEEAKPEKPKKSKAFFKKRSFQRPQNSIWW